VAGESEQVQRIFGRGLEEQQAGRFDEAEALFRSIVRPDFAEAHLALGNALVAQGRLEEGAESYLASLRARPGFDLAAGNLRIVRKAQGRAEAAVEVELAALRHSYFEELFWGTADNQKFAQALMSLIGSIPDSGRFAADNLIVWRRNLSFLDDQALMRAVAKNSEGMIERAIVWRNAVLLWAARNGLRREGDFVECGVWKGTTVRVVCDAIDFKSTGKGYWLYDVFDWKEGDLHHPLGGLDATLHDKVVARFADLPSVRIVKGYVPQSFAQGMPEKIALMHLDMNNAPAEIGALEALWDRMVSGAILVLDDYGWDNYRPQKLAEDAFFGARGYTVLELPTGQGIVLK
jgi:tetratricopeptide (TPR) repeat protein